MGRKSRTGVLKRQREAKKAEKAAHKREKREKRDGDEISSDQVATAEDLAGYGFAPEEPEDDGKRHPPPPAGLASRRATAPNPGRRPRERKEIDWPVSR
jgi:hypothetical protein